MFDWWWRFLFGLVQFLLQLIDGIYKIFLVLAGSASASTQQEVTGAATGNLLEIFYNNSTIQFIFWAFMVISFLFFFVAIIIGIARSEFVGEDNKHPKLKVFKRASISLLTILFMPIIFGVAIQAASLLLGAVVEVMGGAITEESDLAQTIFQICLPSPKTPLDGDFIGWYESVNRIDYYYPLSDFNYVIGFLASGVLLVILVAGALRLVGRLIDIIMLFLVSPFVLAASPLDDGQRFGVWRDLVISKLLGVAGMVLSLYLYFILLNILSEIIIVTTFLSGVFYLIFAIGGAFAALKGGILVSNLVGHNTALIEGQQQNNAAHTIGHTTMVTARMAMRLAGTSIGLLSRGARAAGSALPDGDDRKAAGSSAQSVATMADTGERSGNNGANQINNNLQSATGFSAQRESYDESRRAADGATGATPPSESMPSNQNITQNLNSGQQNLTQPPSQANVAQQAVPSAPSVPESLPESRGDLSKAMQEDKSNLGGTNREDKDSKK